ncbi:MAG TPA: hypothetical protein DD827_12125 [Gammaproteobacteria bacterium]|nr:hypothetical protein [Gammaproteobacteria bacterium]
MRGKKLPLEIYEIQADLSATTNGAQFSQAIREFQAGNLIQAGSLFLASTQNNPDLAAQFYIQKCRQLGQAPLDSNWDGIVIVK